jgi:hypothetical protein
MVRDNGKYYILQSHFDAAVAPLVRVEGEMRLPFIGLVLGVAALISLARLRRARDPHVRACIVAFAVALALSVTPPSPPWLWKPFSAMFFFRDPMVFFGLLAAGGVLQWGLESRRLALRAGVWLLLAVQVAQQSAVVLVGYGELEGHRGILDFYKYQRTATGLAKSLAGHARQLGPRVYASSHVQLLARGALSPYGIHEITDLVFLGLNPINGYFKVVSMDRLHPSRSLMHGLIVGQRDVFDNGALLDVLGVNIAVMSEEDGDVPVGLQVLERMRADTIRGSYDLTLLGNPDAWPVAVLLRPGVESLALRTRPGCGHTAALCLDYEPLQSALLSDRVSVKQTVDGYAVSIPPSDAERLLFVSATWRKEWRARMAAGELPVVPVANAFVGVRLPAGVDQVRLDFVPRVRIALTWFSGVSFLALLAAFVVASRRSRASTDAEARPENPEVRARSD